MESEFVLDSLISPLRSLLGRRKNSNINLIRMFLPFVGYFADALSMVSRILIVFDSQKGNNMGPGLPGLPPTNFVIRVFFWVLDYLGFH